MVKIPKAKNAVKEKEFGLLDNYTFSSGKIEVTVKIILNSNEYVPSYEVSTAILSRSTEIVLEKIRTELIKNLNFNTIRSDKNKDEVMEKEFIKDAEKLVIKFFPDMNEVQQEYLVSYLLQKSLGFGNLELLLKDDLIEEIVVNSSEEPVWVYHKVHGWLKTNIFLNDEQETKRYAVMVGRKIGRQISVLEPLLDANLSDGSRVNATFSPVSVSGNTMTFRKFSTEPMTITHFLEFGTLDYDSAALIWHSIEYELSILISGGTASGKTSMLNVLACFFPPNQRVLSIEDTREVRLPKYLHWVPMMTRIQNAEGKGGISMGDLLVNSLRMRPDRIVVGEVRRKAEIQTLFEAIHTGHPCYATIHANDVYETKKRLINPPLDVPLTMLSGVSLIVNQYRNRRSGKRRMFQIAEINKDSEVVLLKQYNPKTDKFMEIKKSKSLMSTFMDYSGLSVKEINKELDEKKKVLDYLVKQKIKTVDEVGKVIAEYYINKKNLINFIKKNKTFSGYYAK